MMRDRLGFCRLVEKQDPVGPLGTAVSTLSDCNNRHGTFKVTAQPNRGICAVELVPKSVMRDVAKVALEPRGVGLRQRRPLQRPDGLPRWLPPGYRQGLTPPATAPAG